MKKKYYIAYGSNLNKAQMYYRCPTAKPIASGMIDNYRLVFRGSQTGSYCSIVPCDGECVPVGIWEIGPEDEKRLDRYEGYPTFYSKKTVTLNTAKGKMKAMIYIINSKAKPGLPTERYVKTCTEGYKDFGLPLIKWDEAIKYNLNECK